MEISACFASGIIAAGRTVLPISSSGTISMIGESSNTGFSGRVCSTLKRLPAMGSAFSAAGILTGTCSAADSRLSRFPMGASVTAAAAAVIAAASLASALRLIGLPASVITGISSTGCSVGSTDSACSVACAVSGCSSSFT